MYIGYDSEGRITECSAIEGVLSGDAILAVPEGESPEDLLETFAFGKYLVREGHIVENPSYEPSLSDPPVELAAMMPRAEPPAQEKGKRKKGRKGDT